MDIVLISPVSPFAPRDGHRLAVLSDVQAILDNRLRLGLITFKYGDEEDTIAPLCPNKTIVARGGGFISRFVRGLFKGLPPSAERLYSATAHREVRAALLEWNPRVIIIDDASVAGYIPLIRDILPQARVVLRSHNVMHDVRLEQLRRTGGATRPAVRYDCEKYLAFERKAVEMCDDHWAITPADAVRMTELYHRPASYLTVSVPLEKYQALQPDEGRANGFVHVGTLDFRRRSELGSFLNASWPKVLYADSGATLTLAGALWGGTIAAQNVTYCGRVASDVDVYRLGRFALNFQSSTGGVKLKTLTSMAAGRTLLSTPAGVEGLPLESGRHYWDIGTFLSSLDLKEMLQDMRATQAIADAGRQYVEANHSRTSLARHFDILLDSIQARP